tara:strand:+ start:322 stop:1203 length:882 start_codon:yes stop_codon:yes gene_type:complete
MKNDNYIRQINGNGLRRPYKGIIFNTPNLFDRVYKAGKRTRLTQKERRKEFLIGKGKKMKNTIHKNLEIDQEEIDHSLMTLCQTILGLHHTLDERHRLVQCSDSLTKADIQLLKNRITETADRVDTMTEEICRIFIDCLNRCIDSSIKVPPQKFDWIENIITLQINEGCVQLDMSCSICGEQRKVDKCHIIPRSLNGSDRITNIIYLCPTHHRLFDRGLLSKKEWETIDFRGKSEVSISFVNEALKERQKEYWKGEEPVSDMSYYSPPALDKWFEKYPDAKNKRIRSLKRKLG